MPQPWPLLSPNLAPLLSFGPSSIAHSLTIGSSCPQSLVAAGKAMAQHSQQANHAPADGPRRWRALARVRLLRPRLRLKQVPRSSTEHADPTAPCDGPVTRPVSRRCHARRRRIAAAGDAVHQAAQRVGRVATCDVAPGRAGIRRRARCSVLWTRTWCEGRGVRVFPRGSERAGEDWERRRARP